MFFQDRLGDYLGNAWGLDGHHLGTTWAQLGHILSILTSKRSVGNPLNDENVCVTFLFIPAMPPFPLSVGTPVNDKKSVGVTFLFIPVLHLLLTIDQAEHRRRIAGRWEHLYSGLAIQSRPNSNKTSKPNISKILLILLIQDVFYWFHPEKVLSRVLVLPIR